MRAERVLDAGCGTGEYSCWFASQGARVTGIDLSVRSLEEAHAYANATGLQGVNFEPRSVLKTGFPDACFDFVYCTGVLHHTPDPFGGLAELFRVLRPGGKILVSFYNAIGMLPRELRRRIAKSLGGEDLDQRVRWGTRLFPFTARRLQEGERNDPDSALYDYFAVPHESLHTVGEVLSWFDALGLEYLGSFPPTLLSNYPSMFAQETYRSVEAEFQRPLGYGLGKLSLSREMNPGRPGGFSQSLVQLAWLLLGIGIFSIGGQKQADLGSKTLADG